MTTPAPMSATDILNLSFLNPSVESGKSLDAGQPVTLTMTLPPPTPVGATVATPIPLFSASVTWNIYSDQNTPPTKKVEGRDYLILSEGGLTNRALSLVFNPPLPGHSETTVYIKATAVVSISSGSGNAETKSKDYSVNYKLASITDSSLNALMQQLYDLLYVDVASLIVNPGELVEARVLPRKAPNLPQAVTSLLHEEPNVMIRGSIPLDNILNFILNPFRKITSLIPGSNPLSKVDHVARHLRKQLPSTLSLPIALDIKGQRITTTFAPIGGMGPISFSRTSDEAGDFRGFLPLSRWPLSFDIPNQAGSPAQTGSTTKPAVAGIKWEIEYLASQNSYAQPTSSYGTLRNILFFPQIQALGVQPDDPPMATILLKPYVSIGGEVKAPPDGATFPSLTLEVSPMPLPEVILAVENVINPAVAAPDLGAVCLYVSRETAVFAGSPDELVQVLSNLSMVLNNLLSILRTVPKQLEPIPEYINLTYLNRTVKYMSTLLTYQLQTQNKPVTFVIADSSTNSVTVSNMGSGISAFFAVAPRTIAFYTDVATHDLHVSPPPAAGASPFYSSYITNLMPAFKNVTVTPQGSTVATDPDGNLIYNDKIRVVQFAMS